MLQKAYPVQELAFKYCVGQCMGLGASSHNPFNLPACLNVAPCADVNFLYPLDQEDYQKSSATQESVVHKTARVDRIATLRSPRRVTANQRLPDPWARVAV
jgi:hypothetical protein